MHRWPSPGNQLLFLNYGTEMESYWSPPPACFSQIKVHKTRYGFFKALGHRQGNECDRNQMALSSSLTKWIQETGKTVAEDVWTKKPTNRKWHLGPKTEATFCSAFESRAGIGLISNNEKAFDWNLCDFSLIRSKSCSTKCFATKVFYLPKKSGQEMAADVNLSQQLWNRNSFAWQEIMAMNTGNCT